LPAVDHETDWGMRIISDHSPNFSGGGYHYGSVWPLFTGWASVGEYRYHRQQLAYDNLRANALLALDGSLGHVTEVSPAITTSRFPLVRRTRSGPRPWWLPATPRHVWPCVDAKAGTVTFAPHLPADWNSLGIDNVRIGENKLHWTLRGRGRNFFLEAGRTAGPASPPSNFVRPSACAQRCKRPN